MANAKKPILVRIKFKNQITLPAPICETLNITEGDYLEAAIKGDSLVLIPREVIVRERKELRNLSNSS